MVQQSKKKDLAAKRAFEAHRPNAGIALSGVTKTLRGRTVLRDVTLCMAPGGIYGLHGPNGSGKTMLLRALAGPVSIDAGSIDILGEHLRPAPNLSCMPPGFHAKRPTNCGSYPKRRSLRAKTPGSASMQS